LIETYGNQRKSSGEIVSNVMKDTPFFKALLDLVSSHFSSDDPKIISQVSKLIFSAFPNVTSFYYSLCTFLEKNLDLSERCDVVASICKILTRMSPEMFLAVFDENLFQMLFQDISCVFSEIGDCILEVLTHCIYIDIQKNTSTFRRIIERNPELINELNSVLDSDLENPIGNGITLADDVRSFISIISRI
jgi:hypothetical protein